MDNNIKENIGRYITSTKVHDLTTHEKLETITLNQCTELKYLYEIEQQLLIQILEELKKLNNKEPN